MIKIIAKSKPSRDHQVVLPKNMIIVSREAPRGMCLCVSKTTPVGFEPTRGDPIGLAGRRLNRSAKVSSAKPKDAMVVAQHAVSQHAVGVRGNSWNQVSE